VHGASIEHMLRRGELRTLFAGWDVRMDDVRPCSDGRPLSWFIAQKPLHWVAPTTPAIEGEISMRPRSTID
jgi:hypothetical protein